MSGLSPKTLRQRGSAITRNAPHELVVSEVSLNKQGPAAIANRPLP